MPFTESELRAMLEDNSAEIPPVPDLATIAETHGKKIRRRRQIAGATATAAVLAIGALALPGLLNSDHPAKTRQVVAAATVSSIPTQSVPVDVDYSVFESESSQSLRQAIMKRELTNLDLLSKKLAAGGYRSNIMFELVGVAGTVTGFDTLPLDRAKGAVVPGATNQIAMKIRVNQSVKILTGPEGSKTPPPAEGETISVLVNSHIPIARYRKAVPEGARLVAFSMPVPFGVKGADGGRLPIYDYATLIFEKSDRSLIGGPYEGGKTTAPWSKVKTMDELIALAPKLPFPCSTSDPGQLKTIIAKYQIAPSAMIALSGLLKECANIKRADGTLASPTPTP